MPKYIGKLRRGWKDDATGRDDWATYETQENHVKPLDGELVLEYDNGIPRLKIGDGIREFSQLPYMSVDSFILPTHKFITVYADQWIQVKDDNGELIDKRYYQPVTITNATITPTSQVNLQLTPEQILIFRQKDLTFSTVNEDGNVRVCVIGQRPTNDYTIQATIEEVVVDG